MGPSNLHACHDASKAVGSHVGHFKVRQKPVCNSPFRDQLAVGFVDIKSMLSVVQEMVAVSVHVIHTERRVWTTIDDDYQEALA